MVEADATDGETAVIGADCVDRLIKQLSADGYQVIGPRMDGAAIGLGPVAARDDLPVGMRDEQQAGRYRLLNDGGKAAFAQGAPAQHWKRYFYPASELLTRVRQDAAGFTLDDLPVTSPTRYALFGIRACDLQALRILDAALGVKGAADVRYVGRRDRSLIIAINCTRNVDTCFCASMGSGPRARSGYDLALTELADGDEEPRYLVTVGSKRGKALLDAIPHAPAVSADLQAEDAAIRRAGDGQSRSMVPDVAGLLRRNLEHRHWAQVAERCLGCANCTLVCPTCFCATVEDVTDLAGSVAERWRKWDSCFTTDFTYIHGGSIRRSGAARYRQWMTHKLSSWWQQFETSGCVGCGRCIAWCPVGIDITEEARTLRDSEGGPER